MRYISTRGAAPALDFNQATLAGLATDGGLYVPESLPLLGRQDLESLQGLDYAGLAARILSLFVGAALDDTELRALCRRAYGRFDHDAVAPLVQLDDNLWLMELFHGPTLAFKDFALQFLGPLFEHLLERQNTYCTIVGATSGDTGSAAIEAFRGLKRVQLFMLHPEGRVSEVQRKQMTTVADSNIHNIAISGTFDDCQNLVKTMFADEDLRLRLNLSAVNSINWARVAAQVAYYFRAGLVLGAPGRAVSFSVPTGNFGNVFAGYTAKRMGLPVDRLIVGSNSNDILTRFFESGTMQMKAVQPTMSPSMDIQISSNFERLLFDLHDRDGAATSALMNGFRATGRFEVDQSILQRSREEFDGACLSDAETLEAISVLYRGTGYIIDPHSVIGVEAARRVGGGAPVVALGTAHPAKFTEAIEKALGFGAALPDKCRAILDLPEHCANLPNEPAALKQFIEKTRA